MRKILIFEPNPYHFETLPGLCYYFNQLGYEIDCLVQKHDNYGDEFCKASQLKNKINYTFYDKESILESIKDITNKSEYEFVVLNSFDYGKDGKIHSIYNDIKDIAKSRYGVLGFYHSLSSYYDNKETDVQLLNEGRIFSLSPVKQDDFSFPMVNSNFFKDNEEVAKHKNNRTIITIGTSNDDNDLRKAAAIVKDKTKMPTIIFVGYKTKKELFIAQIKRIIAAIISKIVKSYSTNKKPYPHFMLAFKKNMKLYNKVSFDTMYDLIDSSDFIALNLKQSHLYEFSTCRTTGSKQLALGFSKPCIIEENCANYYGFSSENSIIYKNGHLDDAIQRACLMTDEEYNRMQEAMHALLLRSREESMNNLKMILTDIGCPDNA
ncbi:hypothetical protein SAMN06296952_1058 [Oscillospiraceae bacterium]|nr:hypothetical protein SAMN06296952_1058 [Oscillospiraceae bacterium]